MRAFKTRSIAANTCKKGHVRIHDVVVKTSADVRVDDMLSIRRPPIWRTYRVLSLPKSRVGAALVNELVIETTSPEDLQKLELARSIRSTNDIRSKGRPTKKQRRDMDRSLGDS